MISLLFHKSSFQKEKFNRRNTLESNNSKMWYEPNESPCAMGKCTKPNTWYKSSLCKFVWRPVSQFGTLVNLKCIKCIYGCDGFKLKLSSFDWRPMFYFDRMIWVLHNRIFCGECGRTCASIDPRFLSKLPTRVTECFPFITTVGGPGMHQAMIFQFTNLLTKGIMYGTYVEDINRMQRIRYDMAQLNYYDTVGDMIEKMEENETAHIPAIGVFC